MYMILSRFLQLERMTPNLSTDRDDSLTLTITETMDSHSDLAGPQIKGQWIKNVKIARVALLGFCLFGASAVMADGLLTPAISVISAVTGIKLTKFPSSLFSHKISAKSSRDCSARTKSFQLDRPDFHWHHRCFGISLYIRYGLELTDV